MNRPPEDPLLRSARREALFVLALWLAALIYSATYCYQYGYGRSFESLTFVLGFPDWVFWGIIVPWAICLVISYWFAFHFMHDDSLGEDEDLLPPPDGEEASHAD